MSPAPAGDDIMHPLNWGSQTERSQDTKQAPIIDCLKAAKIVFISNKPPNAGKQLFLQETKRQNSKKVCY